MDQGLNDPLNGMAFNEFSCYTSNASLPTLPYSYLELQTSVDGPPAEVIAGNYLEATRYGSAEHPPSSLSSISAQSIPSATSSTAGSPYSGPTHMVPRYQDTWPTSHQGVSLDPAIVTSGNYGLDFGTADFDREIKLNMQNKAGLDGVDPSMINPPHASGMQQNIYFAGEGMYPDMKPNSFSSYSPIPSPTSQHLNFATTYTNSQFPSNQSPRSAFNMPGQSTVHREPSVVSEHSYGSYQSPSSANFEIDEEGRQRGRCPHPDCGKVFKDLKAHMLTHQSERPEKCPIVTCEYNQKGFARKYDKNRHTLTHYKGTMVCGFCPGSGSAAEKSFNRADVFKRHLTTLHGVEQTPPNSRKRAPGSNKKLSSYCEDATGKCSTCSETFDNAQDFYEHLDDCVLRVVQQEDPSEAINHQHLTQISADDEVKKTLDRNMLTQSEPIVLGSQEDSDNDEDEQEEEVEATSTNNPRSGKGMIKAEKKAEKRAAHNRVVLGTNVAIRKASGGARRGLTYSKGGVPLASKSRKKREHYPASWGLSSDKMKMKKRVLCVYDGPRRLWKDDMMLDSEFEVRMKLADGKSYVTDLDVETLKRAEALHGATEEEKGPWIPDHQTFDINELMMA